jgi:undecaprenyl-phosphate galactose phosphotransferase/putative colanic acid biosynthesis UDP-glucose lipid carrier transferase
MSEFQRGWHLRPGSTTEPGPKPSATVMSIHLLRDDAAPSKFAAEHGDSLFHELLEVQIHTPLHRCVDLVFMVLLGVVCGVLVNPSGDWSFASRHHFWCAMTVGLLFLLIESARLDGRRTAITTRVTRVKSVVGLWTLSIAGLMFIIFTLGGSVQPTRLFLIVYYISGLVMFGLWRALMAPRLARLGLKLRAARIDRVVIGDRKSAVMREIVNELTKGGSPTPAVVGVDATCADQAWPREQQRVLSDVCRTLRSSRHGAIYMCAAGISSERLKNLWDSLSILPVSTNIVPDYSTANFVSCRPVIVGNHLALEVKRAPMNAVEVFLKRLIDIVFSAISLVLASPFLAMVALAIRIDSKGPVVFRQRRVGKGGKEFTIYKFRSMHVLEDGPTILQARRDDPRVTRVGAILRSSSIDELPQLWNVLKGDMSLVGPRPHALAHDEYYGRLVPNYEVRHHVKPGLSGWAQVNGWRGETAGVESMNCRIACDIWYAQNCTILLDLEIIARTFIEVFRKRNAY